MRRWGEGWVWTTGAALAFCLLLVAGLVGLILVEGLGFFWPGAVERLRLADGLAVMGEIVDREPIPNAAGERIKLKQGNRDLYGADFVWIDESEIVARETPPEAVVIERDEWGPLYVTTDVAWIRERLPGVRRLLDDIRDIERGELADVFAAQERLRLERRSDSPEAAELQIREDRARASIDALRAQLTESAVVETVDGRKVELGLHRIVRIYTPNAMGAGDKLLHYAGGLWEFVSGEPREANMEGGVFPAILGTVLMVMLMTIFVTPLGVLSAIYLREYARPGLIVSLVRITVNNLAGVPSIVYGVFGVALFIYGIGGAIDEAFYPEALPTPTFGTGGLLWSSLTLALLTLPVVIVATEEGLAAVPKGLREAAAALGATKSEITLRIVLPIVMPSILTGVILAVGRAAGEVAPLMITGVVKLAPEPPVDADPPFVHPERKFMHLGFHIYDVGFQSPNVDAARPMVFATTALLLAIVVLLNLTAILMRRRLRARLKLSAV